MCVLTGTMRACLKTYTDAVGPTPTIPAKIVSKDANTGGTIVTWFMGGCYGVEAGLIDRTFYLPANEYEDVKDALDGPNHVHIHGVPDPATDYINNVAWRET